MKHDEKQCSKCKVVKAITEFSKSKDRLDGHHCWCKVCNNSSKKKAQSLQWYKEHRPAQLKKQRSWYNKNREAILIQQRERYANDAEYREVCITREKPERLV